MYKLKLFVQLLVISAIFTFNSCKTDDVAIPDEVETNEVIIKENEALSAVVPASKITTFLTGKISDEQGNPLKGVAVSSGSITVLSGEDGYFTFGEIELNKSYAFIKAQKEGYLLGTRTFTPTENAFNTISIQLLSKGNAQTFNAVTGGQLTVDSDLELTFPANSIIKKDGSAYNGNVKVYGRYLSPTVDNFSEIMPGMLAGLTNGGTIEPMISYGMFAVELEDEVGNELEIEGNSLVEVKAPATANDPEDVPLWHFNETYGLWIEAGTATKVGDKYVSEVNHFSTWNLDIYVEGFDVIITLQDENTNNIANQKVNVFSTNNDFLATVFTDDKGKFRLLNAPQNLIFRAVFECDLIEIEKQMSNGAVTLELDLSNNEVRPYTLRGQLLDCQNENTISYNNSYFTIVGTNENDHIYFGGITDNEGNFELTSPLCDIDEITEYILKATVLVDNNTIKDTLFAITFSSDSQIQDLNFCGDSTSAIDDSFVIPFADSNFETGIRDFLTIPTGPITYGDVRYLDTLFLHSYGITSVSDLQYFPNLIYLDLLDNNISDVSPIANLANLKKLCLGSNSISDISPLSNLNLNSLSLFANQVVDISPLSNMEFLQVLSLEENLVTDISSISNFSILNVLDLSSNYTLSNLEPIATLQYLTNLNASYTAISDVTPLSNLTGLNYMDLRFNYSLSNVSPLCNLGTTYVGVISLFESAIDSTEIEDLRNCLPNASITF